MLNRKPPIDEILSEFQNSCKQNPQLQSTVKLELEKLVRKLYSDAIAQHVGWCMSFKIPEVEVLNILNIIGIDQQKLSSAFATQWKAPPSAHMINNPYYHTLLFLALYGIREHKIQLISENAMVLLLARIWNGRRQKYIQFCDPDVMRYVVANMSGKYLARKYDSPIALIRQHYASYLLKTYSNRIKADSTMTKRLFDQSWNRIRQLFISDMAPNIKTGRSEGRSGIAPLYFDAKEKGNKIATPKPGAKMRDDDNELSSIEQYTAHSYDQMIGDIANYMMMNAYNKYDDSFIRFVNRETSAKAEKIKILLDGIHSVRYNDYIQDVLELMFSQIQIGDRSDICNQTFFNVVKKRIISSKHSQTVTQLKKVVDLLLERIFDDKIQYVHYNDYSTPMRGKLRNIIFYGFAYNIQKYVCAK